MPYRVKVTRKCILFTTFGSLGDLHPYLAIGQELHGRGHQVRVATLGLFEDRVLAAGLEFRPLRAATIEQPSSELIRDVFAGASGVRFLLRDLLMPALGTAFEDTRRAAAGADLLISHPITFATPLVAQTLGLPWLATQLAPSGLPSAFDPPVWPGLRFIPRGCLSRPMVRMLFRLADWQLRRWLRPVDQLRESLHLPDRGNPFFRGGHSPFGTLALFSPLLGPRQPDWPQNVTVTGFPFYEAPDAAKLSQSPESVLATSLDTWLASGPAPVVFTLGSSAVMDPGAFFRESMAAADRLGVRALLIGYTPAASPGKREHGADPCVGGVLRVQPSVFTVPYASYATTFARGAAVVHQGGIGTTAEALRSGRPMLVVPFGVDQPDNAARAARLGVARVLRRERYTASRVARALGLLLQEPFRGHAEMLGEAIRAEQGAFQAAEAIEALL